MEAFQQYGKLLASAQRGEVVVGCAELVQQRVVGVTEQRQLDVAAAGLAALGGYSETGDTFSQAAFLWQGGEMFDMNELADTGNKPHLQWATAINDAGHVTGFSRVFRSESEEHGFLLIPNGNWERKFSTKL